jgi:hypothetical protein
MDLNLLVVDEENYRVVIRKTGLFTGACLRK